MNDVDLQLGERIRKKAASELGKKEERGENVSDSSMCRFFSFCSSNQRPPSSPPLFFLLLRLLLNRMNMNGEGGERERERRTGDREEEEEAEEMLN